MYVCICLRVCVDSVHWMLLFVHVLMCDYISMSECVCSLLEFVHVFGCVQCLCMFMCTIRG